MEKGSKKMRTKKGEYYAGNKKAKKAPDLLLCDRHADPAALQLSCHALAGAEAGTGSGLRNFYDHDEREKYWSGGSTGTGKSDHLYR